MELSKAFHLHRAEQLLRGCRLCQANYIETKDRHGCAFREAILLVPVSMDISEAFDQMCHVRLFERLYEVSLSVTLIKWALCCLRNRKIQVRVNGSLFVALKPKKG